MAAEEGASRTMVRLSDSMTHPAAELSNQHEGEMCKNYDPINAGRPFPFVLNWRHIDWKLVILACGNEVYRGLSKDSTNPVTHPRKK